jgi:hypothetical protein
MLWVGFWKGLIEEEGEKNRGALGICSIPANHLWMSNAKRPMGKKKTWYHCTSGGEPSSRLKTQKKIIVAIPHNLALAFRLTAEHLIQKRQRARRLELSIVRLRNSDLHTRDVSRSVRGRTSVIVTVRLDDAEQLALL